MAGVYRSAKFWESIRARSASCVGVGFRVKLGGNASLDRLARAAGQQRQSRAFPEIHTCPATRICCKNSTASLCKPLLGVSKRRHFAASKVQFVFCEQGDHSSHSPTSRIKDVRLLI